MKLELKENMYCRSRGGAIGKIVSLEDFNEREYKLNGFYIDKNAIVKASYNIIDLIEVGDYVNGLPVQKINKYLSTNEKYLDLLGSCSDWENEDIKSVITHEQMKQMKYKVDDE